jgi:hypothetical protein
MLTVVHLPKLTYIATTLDICDSHASFIVPAGPPNAPEGGLRVSGPLKGKESCSIQQGAVTCSFLTVCP